MEFTDIATEQTTAVTDLILAILSFFVAIYIYRIGKDCDRTKSIIWSCIFGLMALASVSGSAAHGVHMSFGTQILLWQWIMFSLGITVSLFCIGVTYDLLGFRIPKWLTVTFLATGAAFFAVTKFYESLFFVFVLYETLAMFFSLAVYTILASRKKVPGSWHMAVGVLVTMLASLIQVSGPFQFNAVWPFDHNGIFHFVQMIGLIFFLLGLRTEFLGRIPSK